MKFALPETYPDTDHLPFNRLALDDDFHLEVPDKDPGQDGVWLLMQGTRVLVTTELQLPNNRQAGAPATTGEGLHIGTWQGQPCRLCAIKSDFSLPPGLKPVNILGKEPGLPLALLSLAGVGNAILHWEKTSRCCDNCGGRMSRIAGEWGKRCTKCAAQHYPRIHPCIIVLIQRQDQILLVRKPEWATGRFGLVAGFVEFGENLEQCVAREVREETGLEVDNIRYQGSQSWPFPSQLMTGFVADYASGELKLQADELADGGWFKLDRLPELPPRRSIARWLIDQAGQDL